MPSQSDCIMSMLPAPHKDNSWRGSVQDVGSIRKRSPVLGSRGSPPQARRAAGPPSGQQDHQEDGNPQSNQCFPRAFIHRYTSYRCTSSGVYSPSEARLPARRMLNPPSARGASRHQVGPGSRDDGVGHPRGSSLSRSVYTALGGRDPQTSRPKGLGMVVLAGRTVPAKNMLSGLSDPTDHAGVPGKFIPMLHPVAREHV
jgi:hypothetical protein